MGRGAGNFPMEIMDDENYEQEEFSLNYSMCNNKFHGSHTFIKVDY